MSHYNKQREAETVNECEPKGVSLKDLYIDLFKVTEQARQTKNMFTKAAKAEEAAIKTLKVIKEIIIKIEQLEKLNGVK